MTKEAWDARYAIEGYRYGFDPNDLVRDEAHRIPPGPVLCLAEGEGRNAVFLAERGHAVTALDYSPVGLAKAVELARMRGVTITIVEADLASYDLATGAWSGIVASFMHLPTEIRHRVYTAIPRALRPGGVFIHEAYRPEQVGRGTGGPDDPRLMPTLAELRRELAALELVIARDVERDVSEGPRRGVGATVQIVGVLD
jgi:SAM-dependent methyltransferase